MSTWNFSHRHQLLKSVNKKKVLLIKLQGVEYIIFCLHPYFSESLCLASSQLENKWARKTTYIQKGFQNYWWHHMPQTCSAEHYSCSGFTPIYFFCSPFSRFALESSHIWATRKLPKQLKKLRTFQVQDLYKIQLFMYASCFWQLFEYNSKLKNRGVSNKVASSPALRKLHRCSKALSMLQSITKTYSLVLHTST